MLLLLLLLLLLFGVGWKDGSEKPILLLSNYESFVPRKYISHKNLYVGEKKLGGVGKEMKKKKKLEVATMKWIIKYDFTRFFFSRLFENIFQLTQMKLGFIRVRCFIMLNYTIGLLNYCWIFSFSFWTIADDERQSFFHQEKTNCHFLFFLHLFFCCLSFVE